MSCPLQAAFPCGICGKDDCGFDYCPRKRKVFRQEDLQQSLGVAPVPNQGVGRKSSCLIGQ